MVRLVDTLMYLDDVQYTRRDWRNRNLVIGSAGPRWLTLPVQVAGKYHARINEIECVDKTWWKSHLSVLDNTYKKYVPYSELREDLSRELKSASELGFLSAINQHMTSWLFSVLGINARCLNSQDFQSKAEKSQRLVELCLSTGAQKYITGPAAKNYLNESIFAQSGIQVEWVDYQLLPQLPFNIRTEKELSVIHTLATLGRAEAVRLSTFESTTSNYKVG